MWARQGAAFGVVRGQAGGGREAEELVCGRHRIRIGGKRIGAPNSGWFGAVRQLQCPLQGDHGHGSSRRPAARLFRLAAQQFG